MSGEGKVSGGSDVAAVIDANASSGVPHASELIAFADAVVNGVNGVNGDRGDRGDKGVQGDAESLPKTREALRRALGNAALIDAAAVVGNFERMVRVADGSGIPLDEELEIYTQDIREELDLGRFGSAVNTKLTTG